MEPFGGALSLALIILYILVKDVTVPLLRRFNNRRNPPPANKDFLAELEAFKARTEARFEEQQRTNERLEANVRRIFERLDAEKRR